MQSDFFKVIFFLKSDLKELCVSHNNFFDAVQKMWPAQNNVKMIKLQFYIIVQRYNGQLANFLGPKHSIPAPLSKYSMFPLSGNFHRISYENNYSLSSETLTQFVNWQKESRKKKRTGLWNTGVAVTEVKHQSTVFFENLLNKEGEKSKIHLQHFVQIFPCSRFQKIQPINSMFIFKTSKIGYKKTLK